MIKETEGNRREQDRKEKEETIKNENKQGQKKSQDKNVKNVKIDWPVMNKLSMRDLAKKINPKLLLPWGCEETPCTIPTHKGKHTCR